MSSIGRSFGFSARLLRALQVRHDLVPWSPHVAEVLREHAKASGHARLDERRAHQQFVVQLDGDGGPLERPGHPLQVVVMRGDGAAAWRPGLPPAQTGAVRRPPQIPAAVHTDTTTGTRRQTASPSNHVARSEPTIQGTTTKSSPNRCRY